MKYEHFDRRSLSLTTCRYDGSRLNFRGPGRPLEGPLIVFVGGDETYGRFVAEPYPALVERHLGKICVNFAQAAASVEVFLHDAFVKDVCRNAALTIVAATGAHNLSNRLYSVHPRRNDRFVKPSEALRVLYPDVDFTDFTFTRPLLRGLYQADPDRFSVVRQELQLAWVARMRTFLNYIGPNVVLLWFAPAVPDREPDNGSLGPDPLFLSEDIISELRPLVRETVMVSAQGPSIAAVYADYSAHGRVAASLLQPIQTALQARHGVLL